MVGAKWNTSGPSRNCHLSSNSFSSKSSAASSAWNSKNNSLSSSRSSLFNVSGHPNNNCQSKTNELSARPRSTTFHTSNQQLNQNSSNHRNINHKTRLTQAKSNSNLNKNEPISGSGCGGGGGGGGLLNDSFMNRRDNYYHRNGHQQIKLNASLTERSQDSPINEMVGLALKRPVLRIKRGTRGFGFTLRAIKVG